MWCLCVWCVGVCSFLKHLRSARVCVCVSQCVEVYMRHWELILHACIIVNFDREDVFGWRDVIRVLISVLDYCDALGCFRFVICVLCLVTCVLAPVCSVPQLCAVCCPVSCCVVLCFVGFCCIVLCCVVLCYVLLCRVASCRVVSRCVVLCCVVLCCAVLYCVVLCDALYVALSCVVLCCALLCCVV